MLVIFNFICPSIVDLILTVVIRRCRVQYQSVQSKIMDDQNCLLYVDLGVDVWLTNGNKVAILEGSWPTAHQFVFPPRYVQLFVVG